MNTENYIPIQSTKNAVSSQADKENTGNISDQIDVYDVFSAEYIDKLKLELMAEISLRIPRSKIDDTDLFREAEELLQDVRSYSQDTQPESQPVFDEIRENIQTDTQPLPDVIQETLQTEIQPLPDETWENIPTDTQPLPDVIQETLQTEAPLLSDEVQETIQADTQPVSDEVLETIQTEAQPDPIDIPENTELASQDGQEKDIEAEIDLVAESIKRGWPMEPIEPEEKKPVQKIEAPYDFDFVW